MGFEHRRGHSDNKVTLIGEVAVGKTALLTQLADGRFTDSGEPTIGAAAVRHVFSLAGRDEGATGSDRPDKFTLIIWDTSGGERYRSLSPFYLRGSKAVLIVFSVASVDSYRAVPSWLEMASSYAPEARKYLIGTKRDLEAEVDLEGAANFARDHGMVFLTATAREHDPVADLFQQVAEDVAREQRPVETGSRLLPRVAEAERKGCC